MTLFSGDPWGLATIVKDLVDKIYDIEMHITSPGNYPTSPVMPEQPTIGGVPINKQLEAPLGDTWLWNSYYDNVYIDGVWLPDPDPAAVSYYAVDLARKDLIAGTYQFMQTYITFAPNIRIAGLDASTTYGVRVYAVNKLGFPGLAAPSSGYTDVATGRDATIPPAVTNVVVARGATTAVVTFTALTEAQAPDVANGKGLYQVEIAGDSLFASPYASMRTGANVAMFRVPTEGTFWARVAAIDEGGNQGPWAVSGSSALAGGVIDSMLVGEFTAAHITYGTMKGDRIETNTLSAASLKTSLLTVQTIQLIGGSLVAGDPISGGGVVYNSQGIRLYDLQGNPVVILDTFTGSATFTGTVSASKINSSDITGGTIVGSIFKTAATGQRIEMLTSFADHIYFESGHVSQVAAGYLLAQGGATGGAIYLKPSDHGGWNPQLSLFSGYAGATASYATLAALNVTIGQANAAVSILDILYTGHAEMNYNSPNGTWGSAQIICTNPGATFNHSFITFWNQTYSVAPSIRCTGSDYPEAYKTDGTPGKIGATALQVTSTPETKRNIKAMKSGSLERVRGLKPVSFNRLDSVNADGKKVKGEAAHGFVVDDVAQVIPDAVEYDADGKPMKYDLVAVVSVLAHAVQELSAKVDALER